MYSPVISNYPLQLSVVAAELQCVQWPPHARFILSHKAEPLKVTAVFFHSALYSCGGTDPPLQAATKFRHKVSDHFARVGGGESDLPNTVISSTQCGVFSHIFQTFLYFPHNIVCCARCTKQCYLHDPVPVLSKSALTNIGIFC